MSAPYNTEHLELPFGTIANKRTSLVFDQPDVSSDLSQRSALPYLCLQGQEMAGASAGDLPRSVLSDG